MNLIERLLRRKTNSAAIAKDRLQIIIAQEHVRGNRPDFLPVLRREIMELISRHLNVDPNKVQVDLQKRDNSSILELNVVLPDEIAQLSTL